MRVDRHGRSRQTWESRQTDGKTKTGNIQMGTDSRQTEEKSKVTDRQRRNVK